MYPPYSGPQSMPRDTLNNAMLAHTLETLRLSSGYISSTWLIIIGIIIKIASIVEKPEKNNPKPISIKLFGNRVLGPIQKFDIPERNRPAQVKLIGFIILLKNGTIKANTVIPMIKILYMSP